MHSKDSKRKAEKGGKYCSANSKYPNDLLRSGIKWDEGNPDEREIGEATEEGEYVGI